jgi:hypothetical protein
MKRIESADPYEKRLKSITLDGKVKGGLPAWVVKHYGEADLFGTFKNPNDKVNFGVVVVKSLQWPGAHTFYTQGKWLQVYVGDGLKYEQKTYYPIFPPIIMDDPIEKSCFSEVCIYSLFLKSLFSRILVDTVKICNSSRFQTIKMLTKMNSD